jgi:hypothetical protein
MPINIHGVECSKLPTIINHMHTPITSFFLTQYERPLINPLRFVQPAAYNCRKLVEALSWLSLLLR